jgi:hypothetical protein
VLTFQRSLTLRAARCAVRALAVACSITGAAQAGPWLEPGDARLRHDLQLLSEAGIVRAPLTAWPVSWPEIARDIRDVRGERQPLHVGAALARVRRAAGEATRLGELHIDASIAGSEKPVMLRRFDEVPRESGEVTLAAESMASAFAFRAEVTGAADPADGDEVRPDGSYVAWVAGNWMMHAGYVDRWWGPGWEGSLVYGSNQRPIPSITIERNYSDAFEHPWLRWIGQWRLVATMGQLEDDREDAPNAQLFGMRATWKPHARLEVGINRTAQWCGNGRPCDLDTFWDLLIGNDNDQALEDQPGNQLGGFDARWSIPGAPIAVYAQAIGEDEANFMPSKYLGMVGAEAWGGMGEMSWRVHVEAADTTCDFYHSEPAYGCAYQNNIYFDGYQYLDRSIGHAIDGDSRQVAAGAMLVAGDGSSWELAFQEARLNRRSANEVHSVSPVANELRSVDLHHRRGLLGGDLRIGIGYEGLDVELPGSRDGIRGYLRWSGRF